MGAFLRTSASLGLVARVRLQRGLPALLLCLASVLVVAQTPPPPTLLVNDQTALGLVDRFGPVAAFDIDRYGTYYAFTTTNGTAIFFRVGTGGVATRVMQLGDPLPGYAGSYCRSFGTTKVNSNGWFAFSANCSLADGFVVSAILESNGSSTSVMYLSNQVAPGTGGMLYGRTLNIVGFNDNYNLAYTAALQSPDGSPLSLNKATLFIDGTRIIGVGDPVPGLPAQTLLTLTPSSLNNQARVLFSAALSGGGSGWFLGSSGGAQKVVAYGDALPAPYTGTFTSSQGSALLNNFNQVVFGPTSNGIWGFDGVSLWRVAGGGDSISGTGLGIGSLGSLHLLAGLNDYPFVAFTSSTTGGGNYSNVIFLAYFYGGLTYAPAYTTETVPDLGLGLTAFDSISLNNNNEVSFRGNLGGAVNNNPFTNTYGAFRWNQYYGLATFALDGDYSYLPNGGYLNLSAIARTRMLDSGYVHLPSNIISSIADYAELQAYYRSYSSYMNTGDTLPGGAQVSLQSVGVGIAGNYVAFAAHYAGGQLSLFRAQIGGSITKVVTTGDAAPGGTGGIVRITPGSEVSINSSGQVPFRAEVVGGSGGVGIFVGDPNTGLSRIAASGDPAPNPASPTDIFNTPIVSTYVPSPINASGQVVFAATLAPSGRLGLFVGSPGRPPDRIAITGETSPIGGTFASFSTTTSSINDSGQVAFWAPTSAPTNQALYIGTPGGFVSKVVALGDAGPAGTTFSSLPTRFGFNNNGEVIFPALLSGGRPAGIFVGTAYGSPQAIALEGDAAPSGGTYVFSKYALDPDVAIDDADDIAFRADLTGGTADSGIFLRRGPLGTVQTVALQGQAVPNTGGVFSTFPTTSGGAGDNLTLAPTGELAFTGFAQYGTSAYFGWFRFPMDKTLQKMQVRGETAPGSGGGTLTISSQHSPSATYLPIFAGVAGGTFNNGIYLYLNGRLPLTVAASGDTKPYNGTTASNVTPQVTNGSLLTGHSAQLSQAFDSRHAGSRTLTPSITILDGSSTDVTGLYAITYITASGTITPQSLRVSAVPDSKPYDGNNSSTGTPNITSGTLWGSDSPGFFQTFDNKNAGSGKFLTPSGMVNDGNDGNDYLYSFFTAVGTVTQRPIQYSFTANNKVYDATTAASVTNGALVGVLAGDVVTAVPGAPTFTNKDVGTNKTVSLSGIGLSGADSGNYTATIMNATANITAKSLSVTGLTANGKIYDATTATTTSGTALLLTAEAPGAGSTSDGKPYAGDTVTVGGTAVGTFASKNTGSGIAVTVSGNTLSGAQAGNYVLAVNEQVGLTASIAAKLLTVTGLTANNRVYNGTTAATLSGTAALQSAEAPGAGSTSDGKPYTGDTVTLGGTAVGTFASKNVGNAIAVLVSGNTLGGASALNYSLAANEQTGLTANITPLTISCNLTANSRGYDATTAVSLTNGGPSGVLGGDSVTCLPGAATFSDKNVGAGKTVMVSNIGLGSTDAGNYTTAASAQLTASITAKALTMTGLTANNKSYDGTTSATFTGAAALMAAEAPGAGTTSDGKPYTGDAVALGGTTTGTFASKNVGSGIAVTVSGNTLIFTDATNYTLTAVAGLTANITQRGLTLTANSFTKAQGTPYTFTGSEFTPSGLQTGDTLTAVTLSSAGAASGATAGPYDIIITPLAGGNYTGTLATTNYSIAYVNGTLTVGKPSPNITWATPSAITYGTPLSATQLNAQASVSGTYAYSPPLGTVLNAGTQTLSLTFTPDDTNTYSTATSSVQITVNKAALAVTPDGGKTKVYGTTFTAFTGNVTGLVNAEAATGIYTSSAASSVTAAVGSYNIVANNVSFTIGNASNYNITYNVAVSGLTVTQKPLTITANDILKQVNQTYSFAGNEYSAPGLVSGDTISSITLSSTGAGSGAAVGNYSISVSGATGSRLGNYIISYAAGTMSVGGSTIQAAFGVPTLLPSGSTSLTFTLTNIRPSSGLTGVAFNVTLPSGLVVATSPGLSNAGCAGTATASAGSSSISLSGGTLSAAGTCTITVNVTGGTLGQKVVNTTISSTEGGASGSATANLTVVDLSISLDRPGSGAGPGTGIPTTLVTTRPGSDAGPGTGIPSSLTVSRTGHPSRSAVDPVPVGEADPAGSAMAGSKPAVAVCVDSSAAGRTTFRLRNQTERALKLEDIAAPEGFVTEKRCGESLEAGESCTVRVGRNGATARASLKIVTDAGVVEAGKAPARCAE